MFTGTCWRLELRFFENVLACPRLDFRCYGKIDKSINLLKLIILRFQDIFDFKKIFFPDEKFGLNRDSNPGPLAPKARIIPLDH